MRVIIVLGIVLLATACQASIERDPVKVTYRNSGPVYDFSEDVEKVKVPSEESGGENPIAARPQVTSTSSDRNEDGPDQEAHIMIRRIFLVPLTPQSQISSEGLFGRGIPLEPAAKDDEPAAEMPLARHPFGRNPYLAMFPPRPQHHIFGADPASRSPMSPESSFEAPKYEESPIAAEPREKEDSSSRRPLHPMQFFSSPRVNNDREILDQVPMLVRMMLNSLRTAHEQSPSSPKSEPEDFLTDLNKDASKKQPTSINETGEEIVEIGGQKFLRKTQINRHVGDNMVFVTRRLTFVPLNETDSDSNTNTTTTTTSTTATPIQAEATDAPVSSTTENKQPSEPTTTTTTTTTTPSASEATNPPESTTIVPGASSEQPTLDKDRLVAKPEESPKEETKPDDSNKPPIIIN